MSSTTTVTTFLDMQTDLINRVRDNVSTSAVLTLSKRYINQALMDLHIQNSFPWAERRSAVLTMAPYTTGTVAVTATTLALRKTVVGTDTLWATTNTFAQNVPAAAKLTIAGSTDVHIVSTVDGQTQFTLDDATPYTGDTVTAAGYVAYQDEYALASDFFRLIDNRTFSPAMALEVLDRQEFYRRYPRNNRTGTPSVCTIIDLGPGTTVAPRPRVLFHPAPDSAMSIPYRYITRNLAVSSAGVAAENLSADTDEPIIPVRYRHVLVFYALYQWYRDRKDDPRAQLAQQEYVELLQRITNDTSPERDIPKLRTNRRRYAAGVAGYMRSSRYSGDSRFDEMRE